MGIFSLSSRKPRKFRRVSIYTDEHQEKLQKLVDDTLQSNCEGGQKEEKPYDPAKFNGTFSNYTPRTKRFREKESRFGWPMALALILVLLIIWRFLMTGIR